MCWKLKVAIQQNGLLLAIFSGQKESEMLALHFFWGAGKFPHGKTVVSYVARPFGDPYV